MAIVDTLLSLTLSPPLLLLLVLGIALVESLALIGLLVPGVVLMTAAATLAGHQGLDLPWLIGAAFIGAIIGNSVSYYLGYRHREAVLSRWPLSLHPEWVGRGARFFERYGVYSVFIGRFVGPVRPVIPLVAGMMQMPARTFAWANITSAALWAPAYVLPGYLVGHTWQQRLNLPTNVEMAVILIAATVVVLAVVFSWGRAQVDRQGRLYFALVRIVRRIPIMRRPWLAMSRSGEVPLGSLLLLITAITGASAWTLYVMHHVTPLTVDLEAQRLFDWLDSPWLAHASLLLAMIGDKAGIVALVSPWACWLLVVKRFDALLHGALALGGIALINTAGKALFARARPTTPDHLTGSYAYPSAHTSTWVVMIGLAAAVMAARLPRQRRAWVYWMAIVVTLPMALSRLALDVHWLSDLVGGALMGLVVCALVQLNWQRRYRTPLPAIPWVTLTGASLLLVSARMLLFGPV